MRICCGGCCLPCLPQPAPDLRSLGHRLGTTSTLLVAKSPRSLPDINKSSPSQPPRQPDSSLRAAKSHGLVLMRFVGPPCAFIICDRRSRTKMAVTDQQLEFQMLQLCFVLLLPSHCRAERNSPFLSCHNDLHVKPNTSKHPSSSKPCPRSKSNSYPYHTLYFARMLPSSL